jgi:hypothetical protein
MELQSLKQNFIALKHTKNFRVTAVNINNKKLANLPHLLLIKSPNFFGAVCYNFWEKSWSISLLSNTRLEVLFLVLRKHQRFLPRLEIYEANAHFP